MMFIIAQTHAIIHLVLFLFVCFHELIEKERESALK